MTILCYPATVAILMLVALSCLFISILATKRYRRLQSIAGICLIWAFALLATGERGYLTSREYHIALIYCAIGGTFLFFSGRKRKKER